MTELNECFEMSGRIFSGLSGHELPLPIDMPAEERIELIRSMILGMQTEVIEVLNECDWKYWKPGTPDIRTSEMLVEITDVFRYLINICLILGLDAEDLLAAFHVKQPELERRVSALQRGTSNG